MLDLPAMDRINCDKRSTTESVSAAATAFEFDSKNASVLASSKNQFTAQDADVAISIILQYAIKTTQHTTYWNILSRRCD